MKLIKLCNIATSCTLLSSGLNLISSSCAAIAYAKYADLSIKQTLLAYTVVQIVKIPFIFVSRFFKPTEIREYILSIVCVVITAVGAYQLNKKNLMGFKFGIAVVITQIFKQYIWLSQTGCL